MFKQYSKSEMLHYVIQQMSRTEKRNFRLDINRLSENNKYSILFDILSASKKYDKSHIDRKLASKGILQPNSLITYLFDKLIDFMSTVRVPLNSRDSQVARDIQKIQTRADTIYHLGLVKYAHKLWLRALNKSLLHEEYTLCVEAIAQLYNTELKHGFRGLQKLVSQYHGDSYIPEVYQKYIDLSQRDKSLRFLFIYGTAIMRKPPSASRLAEWDTLFENSVFKEDITHFPFQHQLKVLNIYNIYNYSEKNIEACCLYGEQMLDIYESAPQKTAKKFKVYLIRYRNHCWHLRLINSPKLSEHIKKYCNVMNVWEKDLQDLPKPEPERYVFMHQYYSIVIRQYGLMSMKAFSEQDVDNLNILEFEQKSKTIEHSVFTISICNAFLYLLLRSYKKHDSCLMKAREYTHLNPDYEWEIEVLYLLECLENNSRVYFSNQIRRVLQRRRKKPIEIPIINYMLDFLKLFRSFKKKFQISKQQVEAAKQAEELTYEKEVFFSVWLERRYNEMQE